MSLEKNNLNDRYSNLEFIKSCLSEKSTSNSNVRDYKRKYQQKYDPKFKLPPLLKASSETTFQHEIWHSNIKYNKIKGNIKLLRKFLLNDRICEPLELDNIETESKATDDNTETARSKESTTTFTSIDTYIDDIISLEEKLENNLLEYQEIKTNRIKQQRDICKEIQSLDSCPFQKRNSEKFLKICKYKKEDNTKKQKQVNNKPKFLAKRIKSSKRKRPKSKKEKPDIMTTVTLTDEEKVRIQQLLADIDDDEMDEIPTKDNIKSIIYENAFVLNVEEKNKLNNIQDELQKFIDENVIREAKDKVDAINYEQINWKDIKNLSIKEIDKALDDIRKEKTNTNDITV